MSNGLRERVRFGGVFDLVCYDRYGRVKWRDRAHNLVVNEGLQHILDSTFAAGTQVTTWYVGLADSSPTPAANDTLASHGGWVEFTEYTGDRQEYVETRTNQQLSNSGSKASFPITGAGAGVGGAFLASAASGTTGTLMCVAALTGGNRTVANGDTVEVTYTFDAADDGA